MGFYTEILRGCFVSLLSDAESNYILKINSIRELGNNRATWMSHLTDSVSQRKARFCLDSKIKKTPVQNTGAGVEFLAPDFIPGRLIEFNEMPQLCD